MKLAVICTGKLKPGPLAELSADYAKRIGRFCTLELREVPETKIRDRSPSEADRRRASGEEGARILQKAEGALYALTPEGKPLSTLEWKQLLDRIELSGRAASFAIGGPFGLAADVKRNARELVSLSPATFTHELARVLLLEQLYRAWTLKKGVPYHY
ncbi:MAG: 23S rRNA (pseudouridine(1915)-N(3))-methyltransferase RlmH [Deltaproteobacteria bacterium]|nr:23S rRNA (pseudouridine(1915)-N(3))-methyltransferase RlmH [Deltaproteobacteria bacterium]